ncbi:uncharacterized protein LY79DRAFT_416860 [Colletotrichum navitas]|uniref:Uncharacterized protein n=1 Tax=Colletotrichum navitas TaxID=681940 RepID=A0AAD8PP29_9PEZI|nr:uncharacterized protein LY79DRAFT_416860 [Colletotrichum navitas]KAK1573124.1 hypothetical protein LY79DRAFT_416860 [Colletotrichum navitas]
MQWESWRARTSRSHDARALASPSSNFFVPLQFRPTNYPSSTCSSTRHSQSQRPHFTRLCGLSLVSLVALTWRRGGSNLQGAMVMLAHPSIVDQVPFNHDLHLAKRGVLAAFKQTQMTPVSSSKSWFVLDRMITSTLCIRKGRHCFTQQLNQSRSS